jgi:predicted NACHT family NTPase
MLEAAQKQLENHRAKEELLFPILVEIRKFEIALIKTYQTDYNILDYLYDSMRKTYNIALPGGFFEKYLDSGRALLLFDGLDEVAAEARRAEVRQMTDDRRQTTDDRGEMTVNQ